MKEIILSISFLFICTCANAHVSGQAPSVKNREAKTRQHHRCLAELNHYFTNEVSREEMGTYLNAQYTVTAYRILASMLAQREEQQRDYREGKRTEKVMSTYRQQVKAHILAMEKEAGADPQFVEAKKSFESDPLAISTLAQLAPFIERSIVKHSNIYDKGAYSANFRLDAADFQMLNFLAYIETNRRNPRPRTTFVNHIENYEQGFLDAMEQNVNLVVVDRYSIQKAQQGVESFWLGLERPQQCSDGNSLYSFMPENDEVLQILFRSMLERDDMQIGREERSHTYVFHTGRFSPHRWAEDADVNDASDTHEYDDIDGEGYEETPLSE